MGSISAYLAKKRGKNPYLWFGLGAILGVLGFFLLFFMPSKKKMAERKKSVQDDSETIDITPDVSPTQFEKLWYYLAPGNEQHGPMSFDALKRAFSAGDVTDTTYVWNEEMEEWKRFGELLNTPKVST